MNLFFETIQIKDGKLLSLDYHQRRMDYTAKYFGFIAPILDQKYIEQKNHLSDGLVRCRVDYYENIENINFFPYQVREIDQLYLVEADGVHYDFKWADREQLERLRRNFLANEEIILIINGYLTDTTYTNILLEKEGQWYTPSVPLLSGTMRQRLIDQGVVCPCKIHVRDLKEYSRIKLINAMMDMESGITLPITAICQKV